MTSKSRTTAAFWHHTIPFLPTLLLAGPLLAGDQTFFRSNQALCLPDKKTQTVVIRHYGAEGRRFEECIEGLERLRSRTEEWGVATISAPVAVFVPGVFTVPDQILTPKEIYEEVKKERAANSFQSVEVGINNQLGVTATPTLFPGLRGGAGTAPAAATSSTTTTTTQSVVPAPYGADGKIRTGLSAETQELPKAANVGGFGSFTPPFSLLTGVTQPAGSVSDWMKRTSNIVIEQKIFSQMTQAQPVHGHTRVFFCVVQVSCNPGWRTQQHYLADCSASLEYYNMCKKDSISRSLQRAPTVFSVLPLIDAQTVEMANSQREVTQLAFQLAASLPAKGVDIKAKDLFEFVKRYSRDMRSVTPIPVVNSYSSGGTFGFRFSPSFQALRDPAQKNARAGNVLLPTSFPALITVVVHEKDLQYAAETILQERGDSSGYDPKNLPEGMAIMTHIATRWYLKDRPPLYQFIKRLYTPMKRDTSEDGVGAAEDVAIIYNAKERLKETAESNEHNFNPAYQEIRRKLIDLESKALGRSWPIDISGDTLVNIDDKIAAPALEEKKIKAAVKEAEEKKDAKYKTDMATKEAEIQKLKDEAAARYQQENQHLWELLKGQKKGASLEGAAATSVAAIATASPSVAPPEEPAAPRAIFVAPPRRTASLEPNFEQSAFPFEPALPDR